MRSGVDWVSEWLGIALNAPPAVLWAGKVDKGALLHPLQEFLKPELLYRTGTPFLPITLLLAF
jgi:hypothetical protein